MMVEQTGERLWKVEEVAEYLGVSTSWVYRRTDEGKIPFIRIGGLIRFSQGQVRAWAAENSRGGATEGAKILTMGGRGKAIKRGPGDDGPKGAA